MSGGCSSGTLRTGPAIIMWLCIWLSTAAASMRYSAQHRCQSDHTGEHYIVGKLCSSAVEVGCIPVSQGCGLQRLTRCVQQVEQLGQLRTAVCKAAPTKTYRSTSVLIALHAICYSTVHDILAEVQLCLEQARVWPPCTGSSASEVHLLSTTPCGHAAR